MKTSKLSVDMIWACVLKDASTIHSSGKEKIRIISHAEADRSAAFDFCVVTVYAPNLLRTQIISKVKIRIMVKKITSSEEAEPSLKNWKPSMYV